MGRERGATPNGAGAELIGFAVLAIAVMGLLATGYNGKSRTETAQIDDAGWRRDDRHGAARGQRGPAEALPAGQSGARYAFRTDIVGYRRWS